MNAALSWLASCISFMMKLILYCPLGSGLCMPLFGLMSFWRLCDKLIVKERLQQQGFWSTRFWVLKY